MKYYSFQIVIEKEEEDEGYFAYCPNLPGCFSNGVSIETTKDNIREAILQHLGVLMEHGKVIQAAKRLVHVEELTVAIPE